MIFGLGIDRISLTLKVSGFIPILLMTELKYFVPSFVN